MMVLFAENVMGFNLWLSLMIKMENVCVGVVSMAGK
jgi:hypothetical protein